MTNKFMEYFEYNRFKEYIRKGNINEIIKKYKVNNNYSDFIVEIMKLLPNDYKKKINDKIKEEIANKNFSKVENFKIGMKNKIINKEKPIYYYYSYIDIINEEIFNLIEEIFKLHYQDEREFLIGDNKLIMSLIWNIKYH